MNHPSVCAIMLTANRPELARRAVECFRAQTYPNKRLLIWDTSDTSAPIEVYNGLAEREYFIAAHDRLVIGQLRNRANDHATTGEAFAVPDILIHWDDDDYSNPNRISEQVSLLQSSGADVVGYREMLFWREPVCQCAEVTVTCPRHEADDTGEAWLYQNADTKYALGTSFCYWRRTWERKPFDATSSGEDERFIRGLKVGAVSALMAPTGRYYMNDAGAVMQNVTNEGPRMIARIHGSNTSGAYKRESMEREARRTKNPMWKRVKEWDNYCRETLTNG